MGSVQADRDAFGNLRRISIADITDRSTILNGVDGYTYYLTVDGYTYYLTDKYRPPWRDRTNKYGVTYRHHDNGRIELLGRA